MGIVLTVEDVTTRHGKQTIIDGISLTVSEGEVFGLIGLNGVGKTTLIKSILSLVTPAAGTVRIFDRDHSTPESRTKLAYLPENFHPPPLLTGAEHLRFSLSYYGLTLDHAQARETASRLGLDPAALDRRTSGYSKGMAQQLGLLAAFLTDLPLLILDEPANSLDPRSRIKLKEQISAYRARGNTVFLSSHILADLDEVCDRIAVLNDHRLIYTGTPADLKERHGRHSLEHAFLGLIESGEQAMPDSLAARTA